MGDLEEMLKEQKNNSEITKCYKLFNLICKKNPEQILRYFQPANFKG